MVTKGEQTKESILQASLDLFQEQGYNGTSMRQIAKRAGIALGGIYNHYASKEEIFEAVLLAYHPYREILKYLSNTDHPDLESALRHVAELAEKFLNERPALLNLLFIEIVEFKTAHMPALIKIIFPEILKVLARFTQADHEIGVPIPILVRTFMGMLIGYVITKNALGEGAPPEFRADSLKHFMDVYLYGIMPRGSND